MTALGRGLASLIPQRGKESAEDLIEQIDTMEVVEEAPENVQRLTKKRLDAAKPSVAEETAAQDTEVSEPLTAAPNTTPITMTSSKKQLNVIEESDDGEPLAPPSRPLVTPLTIDPEPTDDDARFLGEKEDEPTAEQEATEVAVHTTEDATETTASRTEPEEPVAEQEADDDLEVPERPPLIKTHIMRAPKPVRADETVEPEPEVEDTGDEHEEVAPEPPAPSPKVSILDKPSADEKAAARKAASRQLAKSLRKDDQLLGKNVVYVALGDIEVNPLQPRRKFDKAELDELMDSIEQHGILQPLVVMDKEDGSGYQIVAGERRFRAAKKLGLEEVPCVVRSGVTGDKNRLELALTENVQRQNLNPIEEAMGYKQLHDQYGMSHEEIAKRVGRSRVTITNIMRILQLPAEIQRGLMEELITPGHAKAILMIPDPEKQLRFYQHILEEGLTVRKSEIRARNIYRSMNINDPARERNRGRPQLALKYDGVLQDRYGYTARVKFNGVKNRFEVIFHAFSENEAKDLLETLLGNKPLPEKADQDVIED